VRPTARRVCLVSLRLLQRMIIAPEDTCLYGTLRCRHHLNTGSKAMNVIRVFVAVLVVSFMYANLRDGRLLAQSTQPTVPNVHARGGPPWLNTAALPLVVDAVGHIVGPLMIPSSAMGTTVTTVGLRLNGQLVTLDLHRDQIFAGRSANLVFTTPDCSGTAYLQAFAVVPSVVGKFFDRYYYPADVQAAAIFSTHSIGWNGADITTVDPCQPLLGDLQSVGVMTEVDLSLLTPPFTVRLD